MNNKLLIASFLIFSIGIAQIGSFCGDGDASVKDLLPGIDIPNYTFSRDDTYLRVSLNMVRNCDGECEGIPISRLNTIIINLKDYLGDHNIDVAIINNESNDCDEYDYDNHICYLDEYYENYIGGALPDTVNGYYISYPTDADKTTLFALNSNDDAIDIYFLPDDIWNYGNTEGGTTLPSTGLAIGGRFKLDTELLFTESDVATHEMGHCLGLFHTHDSFCNSNECRELVNTYPTGCDDNCLENCESCGDWVCDTPADPNTGFDINNGDFSIFHTENFDPEIHCVYTGDITQEYLECDSYLDCDDWENPGSGCIEGGTYSPSTTNIMSYTHAYCFSEFTEEQGNRMRVMLEEHDVLTPITFIPSSGDLNRSNDVDVLDVLILVDYILGDHPFDEEQILQGNLNEDSIFDILDIVLMINVILGETRETYPTGSVLLTSTGHRVNSDSLYLNIQIANKTIVEGVQITVRLDSIGYKATEVVKGAYVDDLTLAYNISSDSLQVKLIIYDSNGDFLGSNNHGSIAKIGLIESGTITTLDSTAFTEMLFVNMDDDGQYIPREYGTNEEYYNFVCDMDSVDCSAEYEINLHQGSNFISFYTTPADSSLDSMFYSILDNVTRVLCDGDTADYNNGTWSGALTEIDPKKSYWVSVDAADTIETSGIILNPNTVYSLDSAYWNWVSYPFETSQSIEDAIQDAPDYFTAWIAEGQAAQKHPVLGWIGSLQTLAPKNGYRVNTNDDFEFIYNNPSSFYRFIPDQMLSQPPAQFAFNQSSQIAFYFIDNVSIEGNELNDNDWIIAHCGEEVVGAKQWLGQYTDIPAMGNDGTGFADGYCQSGQTPEFRLYKNNTGKIYKLEFEEIPVWQNEAIIFLNTTGAVEIGEITPTTFVLHPAYPNPFNPETIIKFDLPDETKISLKIYDLMGREVADLVNDKQLMQAGYHSVSWYATGYSSGIYFVKLTTNDFTKSQKIVLVK